MFKHIYRYNYIITPQLYFNFNYLITLSSTCIATLKNKLLSQERNVREATPNRPRTRSRAGSTTVPQPIAGPSSSGVMKHPHQPSHTSTPPTRVKDRSTAAPVVRLNFEYNSHITVNSALTVYRDRLRCVIKCST